MTVRLFELAEHPNRIAISKTENYQLDGVYFLNFNKPLQTIRWFGVYNKFIGYAMALSIPIIHQNQSDNDEDTFSVGIDRHDSSFEVIRNLWKTYYKTPNPIPKNESDGLQIIVDFSSQFPNNG
jgi:hypothetical protein